MDILSDLLVSIGCVVGGLLVGISDEDFAMKWVGVLTILALIILGIIIGMWWVE